MSALFKHVSCCASYDELTDIASTIQAYTSIHFENEEWIKIRFVLMVYSCVIFIWTIIDSIFSDRTLFYFIYATHWILLLSVMLYLICSYVITLVIYERISISPTGAVCLSQSNMNNNENQKKKPQHFEDIPLSQQNRDHIPSLSELGLFKWNKFIVFLQNASLAPAIIFPVIFWFVIYPNIDTSHTTVYDGMLEFHIHCIIPILVLFDFIFSSRSALYIDMYQPLMIGMVYCLWTYLIFMVTDINDEAYSIHRTSLYLTYYNFKVNDFMLWFILNLTSLCAVHLIFCYLKSKVLSNHFVAIKLSTNHRAVMDKNGNIVDTNHKEYHEMQMHLNNHKKEKKKKKKKKRKKKGAGAGVTPSVLAIVSDAHINDNIASVDAKKKKLDENIETTVNKASRGDERSKLKQESEEVDIAVAVAHNSIKAGFRNLIAIIEPNNKKKSGDAKYRNAPDYALTATDSASNTDDDEDEEDSDHITDRTVLNDRLQRFYSLKGNQSDMMTTDDDDDDDKFNAFKTKSLQTLLNLSKKLHTVSVVQRSCYKSEVSIEYDEQETSEYDDSALGLKSGLYKF